MWNLKTKKKQKEWYSGKKKKHTIKTQIIADGKSKKIYGIAQSKGSIHDFNLFKKAYRGIHERIKIQADSGYQGIKGIHINSKTPKSK